ncbi:D-cysteine desulfhydrase family protein [bacterium]|nr:D-cysteine desulfhydrase family protein [bacterium]
MEFPAKLSQAPRFKLAHLPTPIEKLTRFSAKLNGPEIHIKRDDLTGLATGGNKTRKLEFLIADALKQGADTVITAGGPQSNHCRQTAAACVRAGLACHLVFGGTPSDTLNGNRFLDHLLGAKEHWTPKGTRETKMESLAEELRKAGKKPYLIPVGGSNSVGSLGYIFAMYELATQIHEQNLDFTHIVFATSSGGTQAGMVVGAKLANLKQKLVAISIDQVPDGTSDFNYKKFVFDVAQKINHDLQLGLTLNPEDFSMDYNYLGGGYGVVGDPERESIHLLAKTEGILVDPVYAGRALAGLIDKIRKKEFSKNDKILFWHTGGETALHAYVEELNNY